MTLMRNALLAASTNTWLREHAMRRNFVRRSVSRFMPGEHLEDALRAAKEQRDLGASAILTHLGENLASVAEAGAVTDHYVEVLDRIAAEGLEAQVAVKPTQLGFDYQPALCRQNLERLIAAAEHRNNFIWLDMESSPYVEPTLALFRATRAASARVGVALQACLHRTAADVETLLPLGAAVRLVKGAYLEPPAIAYARKTDVDENYYRLACRILSEGSARPGAVLHIATHDPVLIDRLLAFIEERHIAPSAYEFAMLYGIQRGHQQQLIKAGRRLRVLISYGEYWFPWYMRRLAERPANVGFVIRNLFG